jgi:hypothetical protein
MSRDTVADALDRAAEALAQAAHELRGTEPSVARADVPASVPTRQAAAPAGGPPPSVGVPTKCPAHGGDFLPSKNEGWSPYCPAKADDPAWSNSRGYCRINPKNAAEYLAVAHAAPASDEVPF